MRTIGRAIRLLRMPQKAAMAGVNTRCRRMSYGDAAGLRGKQEREIPMSDMPDFSNVKSGSSSTATKVYEVKSGDSLSKIAKREYGDANKWPEIFEANKDILKDPNKIFPGQKLKIPPLA